MDVEEYTFKELLSRIVDNRGRTCPTAETGTALIATNCIKDDQLYPVFERVRWVDSETMETWFRGHPEPGDILFVLKGSPGRCCLVPDPINFCIAQDMLALRADESKVTQKFLFALLRSSIVRNAIDNLHVGTMIPHFKKGDFDQLTFQIPKSRKIQKWIGAQYFILSAKIELNRRMNATLEGMAQELFKSWFVDFDPVIDNALAAGNPIPDELAARAEVRRQVLANGTANREAAKPFPAAFQETESMGWIPEGWVVRTIGEECETVGGGTPSTKNPDFWEGGEYPWVTPKDFSALQDKVLLSSSRFLTEEGLSKVSSGLLPVGTVLMSSRAPVGYLAITQIETAINQGFIAMICNKQLPPEYILQWANSRMDDIKQASSGSTFAEISKKGFRPFKVIVPELKSLAAYSTIAASTYSRISDGVAASNTLTKLRDTLLPKLISGELRFPEAEKLTEEALS